MLKAIIVDDEARSRRILNHLVDEYCDGVEVVEMVEDVLMAYKAINTHTPDIVFLDIEMPNYSGFKLLDLFDELDFDVIFTTAYEHHAIKAFKISASGYLLKPINIDDLVKVVEKVKSKRLETETAANESGIQKEKVVLPTPNGMIYLLLDEICYLQSDGRHTKIFLTDQSSHVTSLSLRGCLDLLKNGTLLRVHKSHVINLAYIKKYAKGRDSYIEMENGERIDVGKSYKDHLAQAISLFIK